MLRTVVACIIETFSVPVKSLAIRSVLTTFNVSGETSETMFQLGPLARASSSALWLC